MFLENPLRILHITTSGSDSGGVSQYIRRLSGGLSDRGCDVAIAGHAPRSGNRLFHSGKIEARADCGPIGLWRTANQLAASGSFDIVHSHYRKAALVGRQVARKQNIPMLFTLHLTGIPMDPLRRALSDFGDITHAPSKQATEWLINSARIPRAQISYIPHGIDQSNFPLATPTHQAAARVQLGFPPHSTIAGYVGRFEHPKNESWVVELAKSLPEITFVMMGGGPRERELDGAPVITLPYGDPLLVYQAIDLLLLPSSLEGFSLVSAEAMSVGRPVLRTRTAGVDEMIIEGKTGFSCAIDKNKFVAAGVAALSNRERLVTMGVAASKHVQANLTHDNQVDRTLDLYKSMIISSRRPRR